MAEKPKPKRKFLSGLEIATVLMKTSILPIRPREAAKQGYLEPSKENK